MSRKKASPHVPTLLRFWAGWADGVLKNSMMERCLPPDAGCLRFSMLPASSCRHVDAGVSRGQALAPHIQACWTLATNFSNTAAFAVRIGHQSPLHHHHAAGPRASCHRIHLLHPRMPEKEVLEYLNAPAHSCGAACPGGESA